MKRCLFPLKDESIGLSGALVGLFAKTREDPCELCLSLYLSPELRRNQKKKKNPHLKGRGSKHLV